MIRGMGADATGFRSPPGTDVGAEVRSLIRMHAAAPLPESGLGDDVPLGEGGLGLDSIALLELILACEERFGLPPSPELLAAPLTVGRLINCVCRAGPSGGSE